MPCITSFTELEAYLQDLNYDHGCSHTAIEAQGILYSAFCTDPQGEWKLETGDPRDRFEYQGEASEASYVPLDLTHLQSQGPFNVLFTPGQDYSPPSTETAAGRVAEFLRQWKLGSSNGRGLIYTAAMDVSAPRADLLAADLEALLAAALAGAGKNLPGDI